MSSHTAFNRFLSDSIQRGGFTNDDVVAVMLPLLEKVNRLHIQGLVAPLQTMDGVLIVENKPGIDETQARQPVLNPAALAALQHETSQAFDITDVVERRNTQDKNLLLQTDVSLPVTRPVYLPGYGSYELALGHHDALTDIFVLGMMMSALALHLDLSEPAGLEKFVQHRANLAALNNRLHPALALVLAGMTETNRQKRWNDLQEIIDRLKHYRHNDHEKETDLAGLTGLQPLTGAERQALIQNKLRNRLFDTSRRNRLLYFKPNLRFLNLTVASVPQVLDYKHVDGQQLFTWNASIASTISSGKNISLSKYLRFEENIYLVPALDRIRLEANRDINEYGFSQLKLAICFLHWYNLREQEHEKISSPLLLVPVTLVKKKGVKDQFVIGINDTEAEINPVLAHVLKDLYGIVLPENIQLDETGPERVIDLLQQQISRAGAGVTLSSISKPRISLIHATARETLQQYMSRLNKNTAAGPAPGSVTHALHQLLEVQEPRAETVQTLYALEEGKHNAFHWEADLCHMVLGNFNYKKMSLVRDYNAIADDKIHSPVFETLFGNTPKQNTTTGTAPVKPADQYTVVPPDATQLQAVFRSRSGDSYIIQGPPGTGKSQTITNLIADYVARGKKVLFVCEKRAAIDVVYHRLQQQNLHGLCCLIHDSQSDKKNFIAALKDSYETFLTQPDGFTEAEAARNVLVAKIGSELQVLSDFHDAMNRGLEESQVQVRKLIDILIGTGKNIQEIQNRQTDFPGYGQWIKYGDTIQNLSAVSLEHTGQPYFSRHPLRFASERVFDGNRSSADFSAQVRECLTLIDTLTEGLSASALPPTFASGTGQLRHFFGQLTAILPFMEKNMLELLREKSSLHKKFNESVRLLERTEKELKKAIEKNAFWINRLSKTDTENALAVFRKYEGSFFAFLSGRYRRARKTVHAAYALHRHKIKPGLLQVVENLQHEYNTEEKYLSEKNRLEELFDLGDIYALRERLKQLQAETDPAIVQFLQEAQLDEKNIQQIKSMVPVFEKLYHLLLDNARLAHEAGFDEIRPQLESMLGCAHMLQAFSPLLKNLRFAHDSLKKLIRSLDVLPDELQALMAGSSLRMFYGRYPHLAKTDALLLEHHSQNIRQLYSDFMSANARYIMARQHRQFLSLMAISEMSMAGKSASEKEEKRCINEGRRILENEFSKSMRYKSIRELASGEPGKIIRELKPVWLMSPLSVSDTLPVNPDYFDVVIYDEASQITLEEGVPPLYRAPQTIIVGDEMQMPPASFFGSNHHDPDDLFETENDKNAYTGLDADSFLTQGARKFPSVLLGWHYRSKHESLIAFSNASFYANQLMTIPDSQDQERPLRPITVTRDSDAPGHLHLLLERPVSYHYLPGGVYEKRVNPAEAAYIAQLVRALLLKSTGLSMGVVAFSLEQQAEIEDAVNVLAENDDVFARLLEEAYRGTDRNQFNGLFFKNLENVQGDERDIIIMSTCYGYDRNKKMIMNFGPINRRGGGRRLNVIFSRAKKHMCVVSSIRHTDITNEHNEGAGYFRKYLQYAALASEGKMQAAGQVLKNISGTTQNGSIHAMVQELAQLLERAGYAVTLNIGQSGFKCHIGIKKNKTDLHYMAGILADDETHYAATDVMEQYVFRPGIMRSSGWNIIQVYGKDWMEDKEKVMKRVTGFLERLV